MKYSRMDTIAERVNRSIRKMTTSFLDLGLNRTPKAVRSLGLLNLRDRGNFGPNLTKS